MTKDIIVSISGQQFDLMAEERDEQGEEPIEVLNTGSYYYKDGKHYVFFEELAEGIAGVTKTQIRVKGTEVVEVIRKGISNTHMIFDKNQKNRSYYDTPYGQLNLGLLTKDICVQEDEDSIHVEIEYTMDVNYEPLADCSIQIDIRSRDSEAFEL